MNMVNPPWLGRPPLQGGVLPARPAVPSAPEPKLAVSVNVELDRRPGVDVTVGAMVEDHRDVAGDLVDLQGRGARLETRVAPEPKQLRCLIELLLGGVVSRGVNQDHSILLGWENDESRLVVVAPRKRDGVAARRAYPGVPAAVVAGSLFLSEIPDRLGEQLGVDRRRFGQLALVESGVEVLVVAEAVVRRRTAHPLGPD